MLFVQIRQTAWRALKDFFRNRGLDQSASLAFYALLSFVPLLFLFVAAIAFTWGESDLIKDFISGGSLKYIPWYEKYLKSRIAKFIETAPALGGYSIFFIIWFSGQFFASLDRTLTASWKSILIRRGGWRLIAPWILGPFLVICMVALFVLMHILNYVPSGWLPPRLFPGLWSWLTQSGLIFLLYRILLPGKCPFRIAFLLSAFISGASWVVTFLFVNLIVKTPDYNMIYGPLSATVLFLLWLQYNMALMLWGGHFLRIWIVEVVTGKNLKKKNKHTC